MMVLIAYATREGLDESKPSLTAYTLFTSNVSDGSSLDLGTLLYLQQCNHQFSN